jgi:putative hemolysin
MILALEKARLKIKPPIKVVTNKCIKVIDKYGLYFTNDPNDLPQIFNLRFKVFFKEFSQSSFIRNFYPIDRDQHDKHCTHIIVKNLENGKIVGTYRAFVGNQWDHHYTEEQFAIDDFLLTESIKCEIGRACIESNHRNGVVLKLLLHGVISYADLHNCHYLFGQSSWSRKNCESLSRLEEYLISNNALIENFNIIPRDNFNPKNFHDLFENTSKLNTFIPPLMKMYVLAGAKFIKAPAYDKTMDCFDYFTLLDLKSSNRFLSSIRRDK